MTTSVHHHHHHSKKKKFVKVGTSTVLGMIIGAIIGIFIMSKFDSIKIFFGCVIACTVIGLIIGIYRQSTSV
jgi:uncharacterized membrane protein YfcA